MLTEQQALGQRGEGKPGRAAAETARPASPTRCCKGVAARKQAGPALCLWVVIFLTSSENSNKRRDNVSLITSREKGL